MSYLSDDGVEPTQKHCASNNLINLWVGNVLLSSTIKSYFFDASTILVSK